MSWSTRGRSEEHTLNSSHQTISYAVFDIHYNQNESRAESYAATIRYNPEPGKVLSARYKYGRNEISKYISKYISRSIFNNS